MIRKTYILLALAVLGACSAPTPVDTTHLDLAAIVFLTGNQAALGEEISTAFQIAKNDFEKETNLSINLKIEDSADDPKKAISAYQKLQSEGNHLIIATGDAITESLVPLASNDQIVLISTVSAASSVSNPWMFRSFLTSEQQGKPLGKFISDLPNTSTLAIIRLDNVFSVSFVSALKNSLADDMKIIAEETYGIADNDVRTQLLKIQQADPDAIIVSGFGPAYPSVFKELHAMRINKTIIADASISVPYFFSTAGGYETLADVYFITPDFNIEHPSSENAQEFIKEYTKLSPYPPSFVAAFGYDTFMIAAKSLHKCEPEKKKIRDCLSQMTNHQGILGNLTFNTKQELDVPLHIRHYYDGKNLLIAKV